MDGWMERETLCPFVNVWDETIAFLWILTCQLEAEMTHANKDHHLCSPTHSSPSSPCQTLPFLLVWNVLSELSLSVEIICCQKSSAWWENCFKFRSLKKKRKIEDLLLSETLLQHLIYAKGRLNQGDQVIGRPNYTWLHSLLLLFIKLLVQFSCQSQCFTSFL